MNTKKLLLALIILLISIPMTAQWKPAGKKIKTEWAEKIDPENVLPEYPRPIMVRPDWKNLNGLWEYAIRPRGKSLPEKFDGKILVPFAAESSLSGVMEDVGAKNELWYRTVFGVPSTQSYPGCPFACAAHAMLGASTLARCAASSTSGRSAMPASSCSESLLIRKIHDNILFALTLCV